MIGSKSLLEITPCDAPDETNTQIRILEEDKFHVMINPASYKVENSIDYSSKNALGVTSESSQFDSINPGSIGFDIIFDGTGVIPDTEESVTSKLNKLEHVFSYDGETHQPKLSRLVWGPLIFFGRMKTMNIDFSLFKPNGEPLRAKVSLSFTAFVSEEQEKLQAKKSSPDLSHHIEVKAGDTLPMLCSKVYGDPAYYIEIARINKVRNFRSLILGTTLLFPPLK